MEPINDHDVLIKIATQVERLIVDVKDVRSDIADVKSDLANRVAALESEKLSKADFATAQLEHVAMHKAFDDRAEKSQKKTDFLVSRYWWSTGVGGAIAFIFTLVAGYILQHLK